MYTCTRLNFKEAAIFVLRSLLTFTGPVAYCEDQILTERERESTARSWLPDSASRSY